MTLGTIQGQRSRAIIEGADLMLSGHDHNSVTLDVVKVRLNGNNREELRPLFQVMIPTYLDDYQQRVGWSKEKRHPPKPKGAYWVRFWMHGHNAPLDMEVLRAR